MSEYLHVNQRTAKAPRTAVVFGALCFCGEAGASCYNITTTLRTVLSPMHTT